MEYFLVVNSNLFLKQNEFPRKFSDFFGSNVMSKTGFELIEFRCKNDEFV